MRTKARRKGKWSEQMSETEVGNAQSGTVSRAPPEVQSKRDSQREQELDVRAELDSIATATASTIVDTISIAA